VFSEKHGACPLRSYVVPSRFQRGERKTRKNPISISHHALPGNLSQPLIYIDCNCTALFPTKGLWRRQAPLSNRAPPFIALVLFNKIFSLRIGQIEFDGRAESILGARLTPPPPPPPPPPLPIHIGFDKQKNETECSALTLLYCIACFP
jgi:hypothetical protein